MTKTIKLKKSDPKLDTFGADFYLAAPPPKKGKIVGLDCHPDSFTAAVFVGQTPHDARKVASQENLSLEALFDWAAKEFTKHDLFLMEAGSNSFEICKRLHALGLRSVVMESAHVGKHAKTYADSDKMAAARIVLVYLAGNAPCVWVPDESSRQRRELLHAYNNAVSDHTATTNSIKGFLNENGIRLVKRRLDKESTRQWIDKQRDWSPLQAAILTEHYGTMDACKARRTRLYQLIAIEMAKAPEIALLHVKPVRAQARVDFLEDRPGELVFFQ